MTDMRVFNDGYGSTLTIKGVQQTSEDRTSKAIAAALFSLRTRTEGGGRYYRGSAERDDERMWVIHDAGSNLCSKTVLFTSMGTI